MRGAITFNCCRMYWWRYVHVAKARLLYGQTIGTVGVLGVTHLGYLWGRLNGAYSSVLEITSGFLVTVVFWSATARHDGL